MSATRNLTFFASWCGYAVLFALLGSGWLYFSYKYYSPWHGGGADFVHYYRMILDPLDPDAALAPFIYRQFGALIAHAIHASGIGYDTLTGFARAPESAGFDQRVFFAAVLSNWLALVAASALIAAQVTGMFRDVGAHRHALGLLAGLLLWAGFSVQQHVLTGLMEGWAWCLVAFGAIAVIRGWTWRVALTCIALVFQRETGPVLILLLAGVSWLIYGQRRSHAIMAGAAALAVSVYLALRLWWLPVAGHEHQLTPAAIVDALTAGPILASGLLLQGLLIHNLFWLLLFGTMIGLAVQGRALLADRELQVLLTVSVSAFLLLGVIGMGAGVGNNVGRIIALATPLWVLTLACLWRRVSFSGPPAF